jgi:hypothetical protein
MDIAAPEIDLLVDSHEVHMTYHKQLALKSDFKEWPEEKQRILRNHILEHLMAAMTAPAMGADQGMMPTGGKSEPGSQDKGQPKKNDGNQGLPPDISQPPIPGGIM